MNIELKVAQLLVSRICHDLAGGVGALSTGAELLAEEGGAVDEAAIDLIAMSAKQTSHRLQFLRIAFGSGGGQAVGPTITTQELHTFFNNFIEGSRLSVVWNSQNMLIDLEAGKLLLNLCLIASESLPRGGVVEVNVTELESDLGFGIAAIGDNAHLAPEFRALMCQTVDVEKLTPKNVHGHLTAVLAAQLGAQLEVSPDAVGELRLAALLPRS